MSKFDIGRLLVTKGALALLCAEDIERAILRHSCADWGELCSEDKEENDFALKNGFRLMSAYRTCQNVKFWVITEADRSATTILLPEEY